MDVLDRLKLAFRHGNALTQLIFIKFRCFFVAEGSANLFQII